MKALNEMEFTVYAVLYMLMHFGVKQRWQAVHESVDVEKRLCQSELLQSSSLVWLHVVAKAVCRTMPYT